MCVCAHIFSFCNASTVKWEPSFSVPLVCLNSDSKAVSTWEVVSWTPQCLATVTAQSSSQHWCYMILQEQWMNDRLQLAQSYFCWWPCVDSLTPAAYDKAWVVPSLPNLRFKLLLPPSPLVSFPPCLSSSALNPLSFFLHSTPFLFHPAFFISCFHFLFPHRSISLTSTRCTSKLPLHPRLHPPPSLLFA